MSAACLFRRHRSGPTLPPAARIASPTVICPCTGPARRAEPGSRQSLRTGRRGRPSRVTGRPPRARRPPRTTKITSLTCVLTACSLLGRSPPRRPALPATALGSRPGRCGGRRWHERGAGYQARQACLV